MIFSTIKNTILFITSFDVVLAGLAVWSTTFNTHLGDAQALIISIGGLIMTYFTIQHLRAKIKSTKLDNRLKEIEIEQKTNK